jgi:hypothetical protein
VDQLVFKRVDLFLQLAFDRVCHLEFEAGLLIGRVYDKASDIITPASRLRHPRSVLSF